MNTPKLNWSIRLKNRTFWVALASAVVLLAQQLGLDFLPENTMEIVNTILLIGTILGIVVDPTTDGVSDSQLVLDKAKSK